MKKQFFSVMQLLHPTLGLMTFIVPKSLVKLRRELTDVLTGKQDAIEFESKFSTEIIYEDNINGGTVIVPYPIINESCISISRPDKELYCSLRSNIEQQEKKLLISDKERKQLKKKKVIDIGPFINRKRNRS